MDFSINANENGNGVPKNDINIYDVASSPSNLEPPSLLSEGDSLKPIHHENPSEQEMVNNLLSQDSRLESDEKIVHHEIITDTALILEQQILVAPFKKNQEISIDSNKSQLNVHSNNVLHKLQISDQETKEPSIVDTINKSSAIFEAKNDIQSNSDGLENTTEDTTSTDTPLSKQSDVILKPVPTDDKSEKDPDFNQSSSLALLAQYDTEDGSDDDIREVPLAQTYQNRCVEIDSDSSTSDVEFLSEVRNSIDLGMLDVDNEGEDEDEEGIIRNKRQPKVKGELHLEDLPPIEDLHITVPEEECTELGKIQSIVEQLVLVNALPGTVPLDLETVLFRDKGKLVLGEVFDVLGQVSDPLYCVRFNSNKEIKEKGIEVGQTVYVAPRTEHTQFVVLANLMKVRGSDASWENDVEPPPRFIDYSDDEEERSARRPNRKRQSSGVVTYAGRGSYSPRRPFRGNYSGRGGVRQPYPQGDYNIVGNSWHSNYYPTPPFNQPQYRMPVHSPSGYVSPALNISSYQQPTGINSGIVINPYAVYPPPQTMQRSFFPPHHHQPPAQ